MKLTRSARDRWLILVPQGTRSSDSPSPEASYASLVERKVAIMAAVSKLRNLLDESTARQSAFIYKLSWHTMHFL